LKLQVLAIAPYLSIFVYTLSHISEWVTMVICPFCRYRMLSRPYAFGCVLRLRTSTEFKPGNSVCVVWNGFLIHNFACTYCSI